MLTSGMVKIPRLQTKQCFAEGERTEHQRSFPLETVSQCHPEAVAEGSRFCKELESLDSSPAAQNDIHMIFVLRHSLLDGEGWDG
jgi:hypothetical protein